VRHVSCGMVKRGKVGHKIKQADNNWRAIDCSGNGSSVDEVSIM